MRRHGVEHWDNLVLLKKMTLPKVIAIPYFRLIIGHEFNFFSIISMEPV